MSEMHEATAVSQPIPPFERFLDSREAAALLQIHPKTLSASRSQRRDTRDANRKIVAISHFRSRRVGQLAVKVRQLSVPSLTTEDRDETDEISARQPSDREACRWPEGLGVPMVRTPGGWQSDATQSDGWIARAISERDGGAEGRRRTSGRHQHRESAHQLDSDQCSNACRTLPGKRAGAGLHQNAEDAGHLRRLFPKVDFARWGSYHVTEVKAVAVEQWLRSLKYANGSKAKARNIMSAVFNHAVRWEWLDVNPIRMVRQSAKRTRMAIVLSMEQIAALLRILKEPTRTM